MPDVKLSQLAAASAASVAAGAGLWTMAGHILGLRMEYVGPASIRVSSGSAWIPSLQQAIEVPAALTLSGLTLAANTWYHLYLYLNGSTPAIEAVTDAPAAPYSGTARAKTGATSRRYVGSFRTNANAQIIRFTHTINDGRVSYLSDINGSGQTVLNGGRSGTSTNVSTSAVIPTTARIGTAFMENTSNEIAFVSCPDYGAASSTTILQFLRSNGVIFGPLLLDAAQQFNYAMAAPATTGGFMVWINGYQYER